MPFCGTTHNSNNAVARLDERNNSLPDQAQRKVVKRLRFVSNEIDKKTGERCEHINIYNYKNGKYVLGISDAIVYSPESDNCKFKNYKFYEETILDYLQNGLSCELIAKKLQVPLNDALYEKIKEVDNHRPKHMPIPVKYGDPAPHKPLGSLDIRRLTFEQQKKAIDDVGKARMRTGDYYTTVAAMMNIQKNSECYDYFLKVAEETLLWLAVHGKPAEFTTLEYANALYEIYTQLHWVPANLKDRDALKSSLTDCFCRNIEAQRALKKEFEDNRPHAH